jgi:AbrB family looped-hinge helix DNA binding protein
MAQVATVTSKGRVTLPASVRKKLGIRRGTRIVFLESGKEMRILREDELEERFSVFDRISRQTKLTPEKLQALVEDAKKRVWKRHLATGR